LIIDDLFNHVPPTSRFPDSEDDNWLRALSIGLVIACHWLNDGRGGDQWFMGNLGVRIFFVISVI
jgi:peptidoglycan/LPS O-acetylase OafA/YrhL